MCFDNWFLKVFCCSWVSLGDIHQDAFLCEIPQSWIALVTLDAESRVSIAIRSEYTVWNGLLVSSWMILSYNSDLFLLLFLMCRLFVLIFMWRLDTHEWIVDFGIDILVPLVNMIYDQIYPYLVMAAVIALCALVMWVLMFLMFTVSYFRRPLLTVSPTAHCMSRFLYATFQWYSPAN